MDFIGFAVTRRTLTVSTVRSGSLGLDRRLIKRFLYLIMFPVAMAPCTVCFGNALGCGNNDGRDPDACPWRSQMASNVSAVSAGVGGALVVTALLTPELLRVFTPTILDTLAMIIARPRSGQPLNLEALTPVAIQKAVIGKHCTKGEAIMEITRRIMDPALEPGATDSPEVCRFKSAQTERLKALLATVNALPETVGSGSSTEGAFLFVLAKLSSIYCTEKIVSFDICQDVDSYDEKDSFSGTGTPKSLSAKLVRPRTRAQCHSLIHNWGYVVTSVGLAHPVEIARFLDEVFYEPLRTDEAAWPVAFELILVYIRLMESKPSQYRLVDVATKAGGMDRCMQKAEKQARSNFPASCFRTPGGNPGNVKTDGHGDEKYKGAVSKGTPTAKRFCIAFNSGANHPHMAKHVGQNGICKFKHACNKFVSDKGKYGRCGQDHGAFACDNPARCLDDKPVTE